MNIRSIMYKEQAGKKGVKIIHISPIGQSLSEKEWLKWLDYIPVFQQERFNYLLEKKAIELTDNEIEELRLFQKERKMASIGKIYGKEDINQRDALEYIYYTKQKKLDSLIRKKLTPEEYQMANERISQLISDLSDDELFNYCIEQKEHFDELSMVDSFVLREISKEVNAIARRNAASEISYELKRNEVMRQRSMGNI